MKRLQVEDRFRCDLKRKEQDHAAALRHAQSQRAEISAELELARQQSQENGKKVEAGEKHVEALSVQLKTLTQELKESRHLEQAAQVQTCACYDTNLGSTHGQTVEAFVFLQNEVKVCVERLNREQQKHRQDMDDASAAADAQMLELQESRSREMDEIDGKLKDVLQRKNATIQRRACRPPSVCVATAQPSPATAEGFSLTLLQVAKVTGRSKHTHRSV